MISLNKECEIKKVSASLFTMNLSVTVPSSEDGSNKAGLG